tara:strand:- start:4438 stop:4731 length:294 start_codon:yes stop_codon:yes gene_type:complete
MALTFRTGSGGKGSALTINELDNNFRYFTGSHDVSGSFTVSGSATITGSLVISASGDSSIRWENLSTSEPLVTGSLWISGSGDGSASGSGYLMIFNP